MVKPVKIGLFSVLIIAVIAGCWKFYTNVYFDEKRINKVITFHYMSYACGECQPQWQLDLANNGLKEIKGIDIYIMYHGKKLEDILSTAESKCMICKTFFITGRLKKTLSGNYKLEADKYSFNTRENCCD